MTNFGLKQAQSEKLARDSGWRVFPVQTAVVPLTGQNLTIYVRMRQRRVAHQVWSGGEVKIPVAITGTGSASVAIAPPENLLSQHSYNMNLITEPASPTRFDKTTSLGLRHGRFGIWR